MPRKVQLLQFMPGVSTQTVRHKYPLKLLARELLVYETRKDRDIPLRMFVFCIVLAC